MGEKLGCVLYIGLQDLHYKQTFEKSLAIWTTLYMGLEKDKPHDCHHHHHHHHHHQTQSTVLLPVLMLMFMLYFLSKLQTTNTTELLLN